MKVTMPFVFTIVLWVYSITRVDEYSKIRYRVISWGVVTTIFFFLINALNHIIFINVFRLTSLAGIFFQMRAHMEVVLLPLTVSTLAVQKIKSVCPENEYWVGSRNLVDNIIIGLVGSLAVLYVLEQVLKVVR